MVVTKRKSKSANDPGRDDLIRYYRDMLLIRRFEEKAGQLYGMGLINGFCHLYIGQEAVVVGMMAAADPKDSVITSYRDHAHMIACGLDPRGVMAELTGRQGGLSKGKGGSMHMFSAEKHFFGGHGNQGQVYESFNMAALWALPVVYVIENNRYAMGTAVERAAAGPDLYHRGAAYGIPGEMVDGMDVLAVRDAAVRSLAHARSGKGPYILEVQTYRYRGHSMSDPAKYRTKEEVSKMREQHDPIDTFKARLEKDGVLDEARLKDIDREVKALVAEAAEFAQTSPEPDPSELWTDVLVEA